MDHASLNQDREDLVRYRALYGPLPKIKKEYTVKMIPYNKLVTKESKIWHDVFFGKRVSKT